MSGWGSPFRASSNPRRRPARRSVAVPASASASSVIQPVLLAVLLARRWLDPCIPVRRKSPTRRTRHPCLSDPLRLLLFEHLAAVRQRECQPVPSVVRRADAQSLTHCSWLERPFALLSSVPWAPAPAWLSCGSFRACCARAGLKTSQNTEAQGSAPMVVDSVIGPIARSSACAIGTRLAMNRSPPLRLRLDCGSMPLCPSNTCQAPVASALRRSSAPK